MRKLFLRLLAAFAIYFFLVQPILSGIFEKDVARSETVLLKVTKKYRGDYDLGLLSDYKYKYEVEVFKRDGWIGYIDNVYSNIQLKDGKIYGLELCPVECSSWFDYFLVPSIWSRYSFDISDVYNNNKKLKNLDFEKEPHDKLFEAIEAEYSIWSKKRGD
jgi:hypothetical protein